ncbi:hypothetical protein [Streptomyces pacificus]|uniref:hypothetical protein n=1 Tax=Streptomyces pacificus TaxID=2705029 RepID=UPI00156700CF|nr:hypothetical protein [Streptomyces pacificus]
MPAVDTTAVRLLDAAVPVAPDAGPHDPRLRLLVPHALAALRRPVGGRGIPRGRLRAEVAARDGEASRHRRAR